jgi:ATP-dependent phosphofructokinase / diphosphate-dependent phosphofructokinase
MEAFNAGKKAVKAAVAGATDKMIGFKRISNNPYKIKYVRIPLQKAANEEQKVPLAWIKEDNTGLTQAFIDYALPLIQGDFKASLEDGLPRFAKLKKVRVPKK